LQILQNGKNDLEMNNLIFLSAHAVCSHAAFDLLETVSCLI